MSLLKAPDPVMSDQYAHPSDSQGTNGLPSEVLSRVFELYDVQPPVSLALVSRQWASIAFTTPSLWTDLRIVVPATPRGIGTPTCVEERNSNGQAFISWFTQVKEYGSILRTWLKRSHQMPLKIDIRMGRSRSDAGDEILNFEKAELALKPIFSCLTEVSGRVETLTGAARCPSPILNRIFKKDSYPALRKIRLNIEVERSEVDEGVNGNIENTSLCLIPSGVGTLLASPRLEVIDVQTLPLTGDLEAILPSWTHLTHLGTLIVSQVQLCLILLSCPSLAHGSFQLHQSFIPMLLDPTSKSVPMTLPQLRSLSLINFDIASLNTIFFPFRDLPLESLSIKNRRCTHTAPSDCSAKMYDLITRCGSTLKELVLDHICLDHQRLQVYLETLPNLTSLTLEYGPDTDDAGTVLRQHRLPTDLCFNQILAQMTPSLFDPSESSSEDVESAVTLTPQLTTLVLNVPGDSVHINPTLADNVRISRSMPHAEINQVAPLENLKIADRVLVPGRST
ncbi:hypothetical protein MD484_g8637, partial [Candolleomyces efflorescens]